MQFRGKLLTLLTKLLLEAKATICNKIEKLLLYSRKFPIFAVVVIIQLGARSVSQGNTVSNRKY